MKSLFVLLMLLAFSSPTFAQSSDNSVSTKHCDFEVQVVQKIRKYFQEDDCGLNGFGMVTLGAAGRPYGCVINTQRSINKCRREGFEKCGADNHGINVSGEKTIVLKGEELKTTACSKVIECRNLLFSPSFKGNYHQEESKLAKFKEVYGCEF